MTKHFRLSFPVVVVSAGLLLGACTHQQDQSNTTSSPDTAEPTLSISEITSLDQLGQAMLTGRSVRCVTEEGTTEQAEYLMKNGKFRGTYLDPETNANNYVVMVNNTGYVWKDTENTGFTYTVDPEEAKDLAESIEDWTADLPDSVAEEIEEEEPTISCNEANIDDSEFDLPDNINFMSAQEMMQEAMQEANGETQESNENFNMGEYELSEEEQRQMEEMFEQMQTQN